MKELAPQCVAILQMLRKPAKPHDRSLPKNAVRLCDFPELLTDDAKAAFLLLDAKGCVEVNIPLRGERWTSPLRDSKRLLAEQEKRGKRPDCTSWDFLLKRAREVASACAELKPPHFFGAPTDRQILLNGCPLVRATSNAELHLASERLSARKSKKLPKTEARIGRPPDTDKQWDSRIATGWPESGCNTYEEYARSLGLERREVIRAIDRHRKR